jgi:hypothetical protein
MKDFATQRRRTELPFVRRPTFSLGLCYTAAPHGAAFRATAHILSLFHSVIAQRVRT